MSLLDQAREASESIFFLGGSPNYVCMSVEGRDALVELADAVGRMYDALRRMTTANSSTEDYVGAELDVRAALERLRA